ncbi:reverse transcriptase [Phytophthora megakarya]|uniref:Reverse transcriptase n=1 Tax=Phytophthora megakarya TaxID=4795 RepID=A0A225WKD8_9STRA|nr:reverse transcriptase [Phytophthora megakarya]
MDSGQVPTSFLESHIFSISKGGDPTNPLNYRPIALLNCDYKIFTRILARRMRSYLPKMVHDTQFGFVPKRTIHGAIDLFEAANVAVKAADTDEMQNAQVLMLDFAKAYDSLSRHFMLEVLQAKGIPPKYCRVIRSIHEGTTARFKANGDLSRAITVTSGIRQEFPLAPLLFIVAVDSLYDEIESNPILRGITFENQQDKPPEAADRNEASTLTIVGYADDTATYITNAEL